MKRRLHRLPEGRLERHGRTAERGSILARTYACSETAALAPGPESAQGLSARTAQILKESAHVQPG
jgi:hypothetical protein